MLRVRQVVELSRGPTPLLFLLDELFSGTNSSDRRVGGEGGGARSWWSAGAYGHDYDARFDVDADPQDNLGERAANIHFADHLDNGVPSPDFHARPGVVQHGNALALMRAVGLEV